MILKPMQNWHLPLFALMICQLAFSSEPTVFTGENERKSKLYNSKERYFAYEKVDKEEVKAIYGEILNHYEKHLTPAIDIKNILISKLQKQIKKCIPFGSFMRMYCQRKTTKRSLIVARDLNLIDDLTYQIIFLRLGKLTSTVKKKAASLPTLPEYYWRLKYTKNIRKNVFNQGPSPLGIKKFYQKLGKNKKMSPRQRLYSYYNGVQIQALSNLLHEALLMMNSQIVNITFDYEGDGVLDKSIELSYSEKYRLAHKHLRIMIRDAHNEGILKGKPISFLDLMEASYELGNIDIEAFQALLAMPELNSPKEPGWKIYAKMMYRIGKSALIFVPGIGPYSIIPITLIETLVQPRSVDEDPSSFSYF